MSRNSQNIISLVDLTTSSFSIRLLYYSKINNSKREPGTCEGGRTHILELLEVI